MGAAKAAKHEIKSLQALVACNVDGLFFPLMAVVDYKGFRVVCTSFIDGITDTTLAYGSCDGGKTIEANDPRIASKIVEVCEQALNLRGHNVIDAKGRSKLIWGPADLEGHVVPSSDGNPQNDRFYLLDFSRLFCAQDPGFPSGRLTLGSVIPVNVDEPSKDFSVSPVDYRKFRASSLCPDQRGSIEELEANINLRSLVRSQGIVCFNAASKLDVNVRASQLATTTIRGPAIILRDVGRIFFQLLRPELIRNSPVPLSSDAFSGFGSCQKCAATVKMVRAVQQGSGHGEAPPCPHNSELLHTHLETATLAINNLLQEFSVDLDTRRVSLADNDALVREMHLRGLNLRFLGKLRDRVRLSYIRRLILTEMIARTVKQTITGLLRGSHVAGQNTEVPCLSHFNLVFGNSAASDLYWKDSLPQAVKRKFGHGSLNLEEVSQGLRKTTLKLPLFLRLQSVTGVYFVDSKIQTLFQDASRFEVEHPFEMKDLRGILPLVKTVDMDVAINSLLYDIAVQELERDRRPGSSLSDRKESVDNSPDGRPPLLPSKSVHERIQQLVRSTSVEQAVHILRRESLNDIESHEELKVVEKYYKLSSRFLSVTHPNVLASSSKVALFKARMRDREAAQNLAFESLVARAKEFGEFSHEYIMGLVTVGQVEMLLNNFTDALVHLQKALYLSDQLNGRHPLKGRLSAYISRIYLTMGDTATGLQYLQATYALYDEFYGSTVADHITPLITMNKGEEVATTIGELALKMKPVVQQAVDLAASHGFEDLNDLPGMERKEDGEEKGVKNDPTLKLYNRLLTAIRIIEDMEGLPRGYYHSKSLDINMPREVRSHVHDPDLSYEETSTLTSSDEKWKALVPIRTFVGHVSYIDVIPSQGSLAVSVPVSLELTSPSGQVHDGLITTDINTGSFKVYFETAEVGSYSGQLVVGGWSVEVAILSNAGFPSARFSYVKPDTADGLVVNVGQPYSVTSILLDCNGNELDVTHKSFLKSHLSGFGSPQVVLERTGPSTVVSSFTLPGDLRCQFYFTVNGRVVGVSCMALAVKAIDPKGSFCNNMISPHMSSAAAAVCSKCNMSNSSSCVRCDRKMYAATQMKDARFCIHCSNSGHSRKCVRCASILHGNVNTFPARICSSCFMNGNNQDRCVARK